MSGVDYGLPNGTPTPACARRARELSASRLRMCARVGGFEGAARAHSHAGVLLLEVRRHRVARISGGRCGIIAPGGHREQVAGYASIGSQSQGLGIPLTYRNVQLVTAPDQPASPLDPPPRRKVT